MRNTGFPVKSGNSLLRMQVNHGMAMMAGKPGQGIQ